MMQALNTMIHCLLSNRAIKYLKTSSKNKMSFEITYNFKFIIAAIILAHYLTIFLTLTLNSYLTFLVKLHCF